MELVDEMEAMVAVTCRQSWLECPSALVFVALMLSALDVQVEAAVEVLAMPMKLVWT